MIRVVDLVWKSWHRHPVAAVVFTWLMVAAGVGCAVWVGLAGLGLPRSRYQIVSGDVAALLGWSNPVEGVAGIWVGAGCLCALLLTSALRGRGPQRWHLSVGPAGFAAGYVFTLIVKSVDPSIIDQ